MSEDRRTDTPTIALLRQLVGFPTVSRDSNLALMDFVRDYLAQWGVTSELFFNAEGNKACLYATIGPRGQGGIALSGHTDVVPVDGQDWQTDPFQLTARDGLLYGRGTADMKGFIAATLAAAPKFVAQPLAIPVHLVFSYDEEIGCLGIRPLLAQLAQRPDRPRMCLIGEPTGMQPVSGHKGKLAMRCCVQGAACHSAYAPYGVNAIETAARLIGKLGEIGRDLAQAARHDPRFDPPYSTVQTGLIQGGRALNIVPAECEFDFEVRTLPNDDGNQIVEPLQQFAQEQLLPAMQAVHTDTAITFQELGAYPSLDTESDSEIARLLAWLCQRDDTTDFGTVAFGTEGGLFSQAGIPAVVCGPGSMDQGHKANEYISEAQLAACDAMLMRLTHYLSNGAT